MTVSQCRDPLSRTPTELLEKIFSLLPRLSDVFAMAATCHRLRLVWTTSTNTIYRQVAPRCILCEPYARNFLAGQGGKALQSPRLSAKDVRCLVRNSWVVEKSISEFERKIVCKVKTGPWDAEKAYGAGVRRHPPYLTRTERPRFIRSYYQVWGMMDLDPAEWESRFEAVTLKQLILLCEVSGLRQSIGPEEEHPCGLDLDIDAQSPHPARFHQPDKRIELSQRIEKHIEDRYRHIHNENFDGPWPLAKYDGYLGFIVLWDHWQSPFEDLVFCRHPFENPSRASSFNRPRMWDDSSDEDGLA